MSTNHNFWRERRAEADSNWGHSTYQPDTLPLGQTGSHEDVPLVKFMYLIFTYIPGQSYCRRLWSLLLCLCYIFWELINSLMFLFFSIKKISLSSLVMLVPLLLKASVIHFVLSSKCAAGGENCSVALDSKVSIRQSVFIVLLIVILL